VDAVIAFVREKNVVISLTLYHQRWRNRIIAQNARAWAKWLAERYKLEPVKPVLMAEGAYEAGTEYGFT